jgi:hypothetical protein
MFGGGYLISLILMIIASIKKRNIKLIIGIVFVFFALQNGCAYFGTKLPRSVSSGPDIYWGFIIVSSLIFIPWALILLITKRNPQKRL